MTIFKIFFHIVCKRRRDYGGLKSRIDLAKFQDDYVAKRRWCARASTMCRNIFVHVAVLPFILLPSSFAVVTLPPGDLSLLALLPPATETPEWVASHGPLRNNESH